MQIEFAAAEEKFAAQVDEFVQQHWPAGENRVLPAQIERWRAAVVARGWSVPAWPEAYGGTGWAPTQHFIWQQACARFAVDQTFVEDAGVKLVGPALIATGNAAAQEEFLAPIRQWQTRWCLALFEPHCDAQIAEMKTTVSQRRGKLYLTGAKSLVLDLHDSDWICVLARCAQEADQFVLVAVPPDHPALTLRFSTSLDGVTEVAHLSMAEVDLPAHYLLSEPAPAAACQHLQFSGVYATLARSAVAAAQLTRIDAVMAGLQEEDDLAAKRNALAVDLAGLQALELRCVDALAGGKALPVPLELLRLRSRKILLQLGALQIECFGYYALPYPDGAFPNTVMLHNEGPIGPDQAAGVMQQTLADQVAAFFEQDSVQGTAELMDRAAKHLNIATFTNEN